MSELTFSFDNYELTDSKTLLFHYSYREGQQQVANFTEKYKLPCSLDAADTGLRYILQQLHIVVGVSYYKSLLGPVTFPYSLNQAEASYWNTVYDKGLGEYAYVNKLSAPITPFGATGQSTPITPLELPELKGALLGIGGGKDSIVAGELLKAAGVDTATMDVATGNNHGQAGAVMDIMGLEQLRVERYLDTSIVDFTKQHGGHNGHIPLSAVLAWLGILLAYATSRKYVVMANEASSSIGNTVWKGRPVNHQWSKSLEFESLTQTLLRQQLSPDLFYFSPIRSYGSLTIMALLAKLGNAYLDDFTSCNLVLRIDPEQRPNGRWCTHCAKCLSTWLLLSSVLELSDLERIFDRNLFQDASLRALLEELLGLRGHKPLDCVGTTEELRAVTRMALQRYSQELLLHDLTPEQIPGPDIKMPVNGVGESNMPSELSDNIRAFVTTTLASRA